MTSQAGEERTLETLVGPLAETFPQLDRATIRHSDQLTNERRTNPELRDRGFYTADGPMYTVEKGKGLLGKIKSFFGRDKEAVLYLSRSHVNPVFNNIDEATPQLIRTGNYILPSERREEIDAVIKAEDTLRVRLSDLRLQGNNNVFRYFEIDTADYNGLNGHQRRIAERVYGSGDDFVENMKKLNEAKIRKTRIYVLNPDYVKQNAPQDGALARASGLLNFDDDFKFAADVRYVDGRGGLRGVRNVVAEGDAPKVPIVEADPSLPTILRDPNLTVQKWRVVL